MAQLIRRTWLPTTGFVALTIAFAYWQCGGWEGALKERALIAISALCAALLTPVLWLRFVNRSELNTVGRGAAAGFLIGFAAQMSWYLVELIRWQIVHGDGSDQGMNMLGLLFVLVLACMEGPCGAVLGALLGVRWVKGARAGTR